MKKCLINLNLLVKETQSITPAIMAERHTTINIESCDLKGSKVFQTIGIAIRNCNMALKDTSVLNFKSGGILTFLTEKNAVRMFKNRIATNGRFGMQLLGISKSPHVSYCLIENNNGPGVQICTSNSCTLTKNTITLNKNGIEILSADPLIDDNIVEKNNQNGILVKSLETLISNPNIKKNDISSNVGNGIFCTSIGNNSHIVSNKIHFNKHAGIKVGDTANVKILRNDIYKNIFQGILVCEKSSAHIEKNKVHENIKANIAFGGDESRNTTVIKNEIFKGRCEGIFMIEAEDALVDRNNIYSNFNGIMCITSIPTLTNNVIEDNKNHGVILLKDSNPVMKDNQIIGNGHCGVFVKDKSRAEFVNNEIRKNKVGFVQEKSNPFSIGLEKNNIVDDEIRSPYAYRCTLI